MSPAARPPTTARKAIKLSSNENPLGTGAAARRRVRRGATARSHRYPDAGATALREAIAAQLRARSGARDLRHRIGRDAPPRRRRLRRGGRRGAVSSATASRSIRSPRAASAPTPVEAPDKDYATDVDALLAARHAAHARRLRRQPEQPDRHLSPTARELARLHAGLPDDLPARRRSGLCRISRAEPTTTARFALAQIAPNVLVTRTFSKIHGLAAERIGWGYGPAPVIAAMHKIRAPFNVTTAGQDAAIAALGDDAFVARQPRRTICDWRDLVRGRDRRARQCRAARGAVQGQFRRSCCSRGG